MSSVFKSVKFFKKFLLLSLVFCLAIPFVSCAPKEEAFDGVIRAMSYNMRFERKGQESQDYPYTWTNRKPGVVQSIRDYKVNIFGTQELQPWQHDGLLADLGSKWASVGQYINVTGSDGNNNIFYRTDIYECVEWKTIWLSETPTVQGSKSWGTAQSRILTFGNFKMIDTEQEFYFFNTHLDHKSADARRNGMALIVTYLDQYSNYPRILTGDFNEFLDSDDFVPLTERAETYINSYAQFPDKFEVNGKSFHGFNGGEAGKPIDFVFYSVGDFELLSTDIIYDRYDIYWLSDHYPILSQFKLI